MGVVSVKSYLSCFKCSRKVERPTDSSSSLKCQNCHLKQKLKSTSENWYAQLFVEYDDDKKITLTVFNETIKQVISRQEKQASKITADTLEDLLLDLPKQTFTYNTTSKVIQSMSDADAQSDN